MPNLISTAYQAEQRRMHEVHDAYGVECLRYGKSIANLVVRNGIASLLDYGSGKGRIIEAVAPHLNGHRLEINLYDPGIEELAVTPEPAEMVTCIDVLEHVEPECTADVIADIHRCARRMIFVTIGLTPAAKTLSDGRNAHINLRPSNEWLLLLMDHFFIHSFTDIGRSAIFIGAPK